MSVLYTMNLAVALLLLFWPLWFSRRYLRLPVLNPLTILMALNFPVQLMKLFAGPAFLIDDGLFDPAFQYALLMGSLLVLAQTCGTVTFFRYVESARIERHLPWREVRLSRRDLARGAWFFFALYVAALYLLASAEFGVLNWLENPREGYQLYRSGQGHWYALAISALSVFMVLSFLEQPIARQLLWRTLLCLAMAYLLGSKTILLAVFGSLLVFLWFIKWPWLKRLLVLGAPLVFALMVWNLYLALADAFEIQSVVEYFDYYKNAADYYREVLSGNLQLFHGEITATSLWAYVPRAVWPDKPYVYGITIVNEIFYPGQAELTNTPAFGGAVEQYADFGVIGVLVFGFFGTQSIATAITSYWIFRRPAVRLGHVTVATAILFILQFAPGFGTFFPGAFYLALLAGVALVLFALRRKRRARAAAGAEGMLTSPQAS